jgi:predicted glycosyltransferase
MILWIDIMNTSHAHVFNSLISKIGDKNEIIITARNFSETTKLLDGYNRNYIEYGRHGGSFIKKRVYAICMVLTLIKKVPNFDINLSMGSHTSPFVAKLRSKKTVAIIDNEYFLPQHPLLIYLFDQLILPSYLMDNISLQCLKKSLFFSGFKEDIYIADFRPDPNFLDGLPFDDFITIRPEALQAAYVSKKAKTIVPQLLSGFLKENVNILYLPRYPEDKAYAKGCENVYIPPEPLNGLDVCFYSKAVLTGSGTFAREAACIGTPAVSFFPEKLLAVDQKMVNDGLMFHSRDSEEIVKYVMNSKRRKVDLSRSKKVQREVFDILKGILEEIEDRKKGKK